VRPARGRGNLKYQLWSKDKILIERPDGAKRGLSITAMGAGQTLTGMHYDIITYDDIMTPDNAKTPEKREGIRLWYNETQPLLDPKGRRIIIGTRYNDEDIYSHIEDTTEIPIYVRKAIENDEYIWKEPQIIEKVKQAKKELPIYIFNCQYLNSPFDEESSEFRAEWIKKWDVGSVVKVNSNTDTPDYFSSEMDAWYKTFDIFMGMDANRTVKKRSDKTAILVVGINIIGEKFVLDYVNRTMTTIDIEDVFVEKFYEWSKYNLIKAGIETVGGDTAIYNHIRQKLMEKNLPFHKVKPFYTERNTPKEDRIRNMQPYFYRKEIFIRDDMIELEQQLLQFPNSKYDDLIDILSYILTQLVRPKLTATVKHEETGWRTRHRKTVPSGNWMTAG
jgi:phage terminase large subunit-like protein